MLVDVAPPCDVDDTHVAVIHCPDCEEVFCLSCDDLIHGRKKNKGHTRVLIEIKPEVIPCDVNADHVATMHCETCEENLCSDCDFLLHSRKKTASHRRFEGARNAELAAALMAQAAAEAAAEADRTIPEEDEEEEGSTEELEQPSASRSSPPTRPVASASSSSATSAASASATSSSSSAATRPAKSASSTSAASAVSASAAAPTSAASKPATAAASSTGTPSKGRIAMGAASAAPAPPASASVTAPADASSSSPATGSSTGTAGAPQKKKGKKLSSSERVAEHKASWNSLRTTLCRNHYAVGHWLGLSTNDRKELAVSLCQELLFNPQASADGADPAATVTVEWSATSYWTSHEIDVECTKRSGDPSDASKQKVVIYRVHVGDAGRLEDFEIVSDGLSNGGCVVM